MQTIYLKKFGKVLVSRPAGSEAFNAIRPTLNAHEPIQIDFEDVLAVTPSWLDEFLTHLAEFAVGGVALLTTRNASVLAALPVLASARQDKVSEIIKELLNEEGVIKHDNKK